MEFLPLDLLAYICLKLSPQAVLNLGTASKIINEGLSLNELWRSMCIRDYFQFLGEQDRATTVDWKSIYIKIYRSRPNWLDPRVNLSFTSTTKCNMHLLACVYDADNRLAFVGGRYKHVNSYHLNTQRKFDPIVDYNLPADHVPTALAVNQKLLAVGTTQGPLLLFDKDNQTVLRELSHPNDLTDMKFYDDKIITATRSGCLRLWNINTGTLLESTTPPQYESCRSLAVNSELNLCVYATGAHIIARDMRMRSEIGRINTAQTYVSRVHFNSDKQIVAGCMGTHDHSELKVYNWLAPKPVFSQKVISWTGEISAVHCDETKIVYSTSRQINVLNASTYNVTKKASIVGSLASMSVQSDFLVLGYDSYLGVWSLK